MNCKWCGKDCTEHYYILDIKRIMDGELYISTVVPNPIILCDDCYDKLYLTTEGIEIVRAAN